MKINLNKTFMANKDMVERKWYLLDAKNKVLGRISTQIARLLLGKDKVYYTPHLDCGDYVIVINAAKVILTGKKLTQKYYYRHSGYMGGLREIKYQELLKKSPERVVYLAVKRMLPKNKITHKALTRLKIYKDDFHPHNPQKPILLSS